MLRENTAPSSERRHVSIHFIDLSLLQRYSHVMNEKESSSLEKKNEEEDDDDDDQRRAAATMGGRRGGEDDDENNVSLAAAELVRRLAFASSRRETPTTTTPRMMMDDDDNARTMMMFGKVNVISRGETDVREILLLKHQHRRGEEEGEEGEKQKNNIDRRIKKPSVVCIAYSMEDTCQPCRMFAPKLEQMARDYETLDVMFLKCDVNASVENRRLDGNVGVFPRVELLDGQTGRKLKVDDDEAWDIRGANETKVREVLERRAYNVAKFDGLQRRVFDALRRCKSKCEGNEERFATLVKTVTAYASNAIEKQDPKYRRIRTSGKAFTERVKIVENGEECLRAFGFEKTRRRGDEDGGQDDEEAYEFSNVVFDEFHENNQFTKRELRRVIQLLKALTG